MKKILSLLLVLIVGVTLFTGCSEKSIKTNEEPIAKARGFCKSALDVHKAQ